MHYSKNEFLAAKADPISRNVRYIFKRVDKLEDAKATWSVLACLCLFCLFIFSLLFIAWALLNLSSNQQSWLWIHFISGFRSQEQQIQWQYCTSYRMIYFLYEVNCCFLSILLHKYLILCFFTSYSREIIIRKKIWFHPEAK